MSLDFLAFLLFGASWADLLGLARAHARLLRSYLRWQLTRLRVLRTAVRLTLHPMFRADGVALLRALLRGRRGLDELHTRLDEREQPAPTASA